MMLNVMKTCWQLIKKFWQALSILHFKEAYYGIHHYKERISEEVSATSCDRYEQGKFILMK